MTLLICWGVFSSGEMPACTQKIFSSTTAARGKTLKTSWNLRHSLIPYLRLPACAQARSQRAGQRRSGAGGSGVG
eukprot:scaffold53255_cov39-Phaeocystis_antarctica.AAC.1